MTKQELIAALTASPIWEADRYGHFKLAFKGATYRLKLMPLVVRYEVKRAGDGDWFCKASAYHKTLSVADGRLVLAGYKIPLDKPPG